MKIFYEKYDDTVQYLGEDKVAGWQPSGEDIDVEISGEGLTLTTKYESGLTDVKKMTVVEHSNGRLIAQHIDDHMGITIFMHNPKKSANATLTLINHNYIVGRYLRAVDPHSEKKAEPKQTNPSHNEHT